MATWQLRRRLLVVAALAACTHPSPSPAAWTDRAPHQARFVSVSSAVRLEVLDFGGSGPPVVFLSGMGDTGHSFDAFAPKLTDRWHVFAITRRGYGASTASGTGYDLPTFAADIRNVLDSLHLDRVVLIGHSFGGDEVTRVATTWPERVSKVVYFDGAYDRTGLLDLYREASVDDPPMTRADSASLEAVRAYLTKGYGFPLLEAEMHQWYDYDAAGRMVRQRTPDSMWTSVILPNLEHPAYGRIRAPALAFYNVPTSPAAFFPRFRTADSAYRAKAAAAFVPWSRWSAEERARFRREAPTARVVELKDSNHYLFVVSEAEVLRETRAFLLSR